MSKDLHNNLNEKELNAKILEHSAGYKTPFKVSKEEALQQLKGKMTQIGLKETPKRNGVRIINRFFAAAALMLLIFGLWYFFRKPLVEVIAEKGRQIEYKLPDSSMVSINAASKISFKKTNFNEKRYLTLEGEAFFNVKKGTPFVIATKLADIKVLGTTFNVFARENNFKVSCLTGKILISSGNQSVIITPGESVILENQKLLKFEDKHFASAASWRTGEFCFENSPVSSVFKEIERQFNVTFVVQKMNEKYFTGSFTNKNLVSTLDIVCIPMGYTYEIGSNSQILIREKRQ